jgi:protein-S-isoprenylcysteine O-methyltransferase Ste14
MPIFGGRFVPHVTFVLASVIGGSSLLVFLLFVFIGSLTPVNLRLSESAKLWFDACLCLAFFIQHSVMVRKSFRQRLLRFLPAQYEGALYAIASGVILLALVVLWQESVRTLAAPHSVFRWALRAIYFLGIAGFVYSIRALGFFDPFGLNPILKHLRGTDPEPMSFTVRGPFRWVRHPLYLCMLLMIWSHPDVTVDRLLFNGLWTIWIFVGTRLEERDLIADFGEAYREYQQKVPMLIPYRFRPFP